MNYQDIILKKKQEIQQFNQRNQQFNQRNVLQNNYQSNSSFEENEQQISQEWNDQVFQVVRDYQNKNQQISFQAIIYIFKELQILNELDPQLEKFSEITKNITTNIKYEKEKLFFKNFCRLILLLNQNFNYNSLVSQQEDLHYCNSQIFSQVVRCLQNSQNSYTKSVEISEIFEKQFQLENNVSFEYLREQKKLWTFEKLVMEYQYLQDQKSFGVDISGISSKPSDRCHQLYQNSKLRTQKKLELSILHKDDELEGCTFTPTVLKSGQCFQKDQNCYSRLYNNAKLQQEKIKQLQQKSIVQNLTQTMLECSFKPQIKIPQRSQSFKDVKGFEQTVQRCQKGYQQKLQQQELLKKPWLKNSLDISINKSRTSLEKSRISIENLENLKSKSKISLNKSTNSMDTSKIFMDNQNKNRKMNTSRISIEKSIQTTPILQRPNSSFNKDISLSRNNSFITKSRSVSKNSFDLSNIQNKSFNDISNISQNTSLLKYHPQKKQSIKNSTGKKKNDFKHKDISNDKENSNYINQNLKQTKCLKENSNQIDLNLKQTKSQKENYLLFYLDLQITQDKKIQIPIKNNDIPKQVAQQISNVHKLNITQRNKLEKIISQSVINCKNI